MSFPVIVLESGKALSMEDLYLSPREEQESIFSQIVEAFNKQKRENEFNREVFEMMGINPQIIKNAFSVREKWIEDHQDELTSPDNSVRDAAAKKLVDETVRALQPIFDDARFQKENQDYSEALKEDLSPDVWYKLSNESQRLLTTAQFIFDQISSKAYSQINEFSCVCLLITKALEIETTKRYFDEYIEYLETQETPDNWPYALRKKDYYGGYTEETIKREEFTLGTAIHVAGLQNTSTSECAPTISIKANYVFNKFAKYYRNRLYKCQIIPKIEQKIIDDCHFIETVRINYRNPAAHKDIIGIDVAKQCIDYVLTDNNLRNMIKDLEL